MFNNLRDRIMLDGWFKKTIKKNSKHLLKSENVKTKYGSFKCQLCSGNPPNVISFENPLSSIYKIWNENIEFLNEPYITELKIGEKMQTNNSPYCFIAERVA